jgi:hypothetical protein
MSLVCRSCSLLLLQATSTDYLSGIASSAGISAAAFLQDNQKQLLESNISLDAPLAGRQFLLCDVPPERRPMTKQPAVSSTAAKEGIAKNSKIPDPAVPPPASSAPSGSRAAPVSLPVTSGKPSSYDNLNALLMAASPESYDGRSLLSTDGVVRVSPPSIPQGRCTTCVPFSVTAAAQTAVATAMHVNVSDVPAFSVQALHFCGLPRSRSCDSGWKLDEGLSEFIGRAASLPTAACAPYKPETLGAGWSNYCNPVCRSVNPFAKQGFFTYQDLGSIVGVQDWIRKYGAVLSRYHHSQSCFFQGIHQLRPSPFPWLVAQSLPYSNTDC